MQILAQHYPDLLSKHVPMQVVQTYYSEKNAVDWQMLRLDLLEQGMSGNKLFKLLPYIHQAKQLGLNRLISFGGRFSNHLHALAHAGNVFDMEVVAVVQAYAHQQDSCTINDLRELGALIHYADKAEYAQRYQTDYHQNLLAQYPHSLIINEGGAGELGVLGAQCMAQFVAKHFADTPDFLILPSGTGTSLLGLRSSEAIAASCQVVAIAALNNVQQINELMQAQTNWQVVDGFQFGGFAKINALLANFMLTFEQQQFIPLDPVYTAKMCFAVDAMIADGRIPSGSKVVSLHTGGLQGRRGLEQQIQRLVG